MTQLGNTIQIRTLTDHSYRQSSQESQQRNSQLSARPMIFTTTSLSRFCSPGRKLRRFILLLTAKAHQIRAAIRLIINNHRAIRRRDLKDEEARSSRVRPHKPHRIVLALFKSLFERLWRNARCDICLIEIGIISFPSRICVVTDPEQTDIVGAWG